MEVKRTEEQSGKKRKDDGSDLKAKVEADLARMLRGLGVQESTADFVAGAGAWAGDLVAQLTQDLALAHRDAEKSGAKGEEGRDRLEQLRGFGELLLRQIKVVEEPPENLPEDDTELHFKKNGELYLPKNHRKLLDDLGVDKKNMGQSVVDALKGATKIDAAGWLNVGRAVLQALYGSTGDTKTRMTRAVTEGLKALSQEAIQAGIREAGKSRTQEQTRTRERDRTRETRGDVETQVDETRREKSTSFIDGNGGEHASKKAAKMGDANGRSSAATAMHALINTRAEFNKRKGASDKQTQAAKALAKTIADRLEVSSPKQARELQQTAQGLISGKKDWNAFASAVFDKLHAIGGETEDEVARPLHALFESLQLAGGDDGDPEKNQMLGLVVTAALCEVLAHQGGALPAEGIRMAGQVAEELGMDHLSSVTGFLQSQAKGSGGARVVDLSGAPEPDHFDWPDLDPGVQKLASSLIQEMGIQDPSGGNLPVAAEFTQALEDAMKMAGIDTGDPAALQDPKAKEKVAEHLLERMAKQGSGRANGLLHMLKTQQASRARTPEVMGKLDGQARLCQELASDCQVAEALLGHAKQPRTDALDRVDAQLADIDVRSQAEGLSDEETARLDVRKNQLLRQKEALARPQGEVADEVVNEVGNRLGFTDAADAYRNLTALRQALSKPDGNRDQQQVLSSWSQAFEQKSKGVDDAEFGKQGLAAIQAVQGGKEPDAAFMKELAGRVKTARDGLSQQLGQEKGNLVTMSQGYASQASNLGGLGDPELADTYFRGAVRNTWNHAAGGLGQEDAVHPHDHRDAFERSWDTTTWLGGRDKRDDDKIKRKKDQEDFESIKAILSDPSLEFFDKMFIVISLIVNKLRDKVEEDSIEQLDREELMWMNEQLAHEHQKEAEMAHRDVHEQGKKVDGAKSEYDKAKMAYENAGPEGKDGAERNLATARKKYDAEYTKFEAGKKKLAEIWEARDVHRVRIASDRRHVDIFAAKVKRNTHLVEMWMDLLKNFEEHKNRNLQKMLQ